MAPSLFKHVVVFLSTPVVSLRARPHTHSRMEPIQKGVSLMSTEDNKATKRVPMDKLRKTALVAGVLYLLTFVSIPTLFLYGPVKSANYILGAGPDTSAIIGGILEIIVALAGIGTAVVLFPVLKKQNEG